MMLIDGVFSGGGIKGYALIGAYQILEEKGYRFKRTAGTSAGSIIAAFIMAGYTGKEIEKMMLELNTEILLDERLGVRIPFAKWLLLYWKMGLFKGDNLESWLGEKLAAKGIHNFSHLPEGSFRVVASDVTHGEIVILPDDLSKYNCNPATFSVAKAIRMSCSIPYFFEPVKMKCNTETTYIVDGGVLSNLPMWLFDNENAQKVRPVLGLKLTGKKYGIQPREIKNAISMFGALFETMKDAHDNRYISRKQEKNIIFIPIENTSSIDFYLSEKKKLELIEVGRNTTKKFLKQWSF